MEKYDKDAPFADPVVRCDSCSQIVLVETLKKLGMCKCGNRKVRALQTLTGEEKAQAIAWGVDPDFLALFEEVSDVR
jgi:hypothetical protein